MIKYGEKDMRRITDIQKYSIHDGNGIRTTVFFKGCPLSCEWCHNPETQSYEQDLQYDRERCTGCGTCVSACPQNAITLNDRKAVTDKTKCTLCGRCAEVCLQGLREVVGQEYSVDELMKILKKDEMFYEESGGGVTLSGGEVMTMDMDYITDLVKKLHHEGISVIIDTCGQAPYENFQRVLPYVDVFLYDIKIMDNEKHKRYIGADNTIIYDNLKRLAKDGAKIYIRIPTIKEVNGNEKDMKQAIDFLQENDIHPLRVNLLPYHNTGSSKYPKLSRKYKGENLHAPSNEEMQLFANMFTEAGYQDVQIGG